MSDTGIIDLKTYCPSSPVYDEKNEFVGWFYAVHIRPDDDTRNECPRCKVKFDTAITLRLGN